MKWSACGTIGLLILSFFLFDCNPASIAPVASAFTSSTTVPLLPETTPLLLSPIATIARPRHLLYRCICRNHPNPADRSAVPCLYFSDQP
jgi:hypothetical protein